MRHVLKNTNFICRTSYAPHHEWDTLQMKSAFNPFPASHHEKHACKSNHCPMTDICVKNTMYVGSNIGMQNIWQPWDINPHGSPRGSWGFYVSWRWVVVDLPWRLRGEDMPYTLQHVSKANFIRHECRMSPASSHKLGNFIKTASENLNTYKMRNKWKICLN